MSIWITNAGRLEKGKLTPALRRDCRLVVRTVAAATGVNYCEFFAPSRKRLQTAEARQLAMYLCNTLLGLTTTQVGEFFGRDRKTVSYACSKVEDRREEGSPPDRRISALENEILAAGVVPLEPFGAASTWERNHAD